MNFNASLHSNELREIAKKELERLKNTYGIELGELYRPSSRELEAKWLANEESSLRGNIPPEGVYDDEFLGSPEYHRLHGALYDNQPVKTLKKK